MLPTAGDGRGRSGSPRCALIEFRRIPYPGPVEARKEACKRAARTPSSTRGHAASAERIAHEIAARTAGDRDVAIVGSIARARFSLTTARSLERAGRLRRSPGDLYIGFYRDYVAAAPRAGRARSHTTSTSPAGRSDLSTTCSHRARTACGERGAVRLRATRRVQLAVLADRVHRSFRSARTTSQEPADVAAEHATPGRRSHASTSNVAPRRSSSMNHLLCIDDLDRAGSSDRRAGRALA